MKSKKIVIVEDDKMLLPVFTMFLKELGHELVGTFTEALPAIEFCGKEHPDIVLMDINLPGGMDGITAAEKIFYDFDIPIIYVSSYTDDTTVSRAIKSSTYGYLVKPIDKITLGITIDLVYSRHQSVHTQKINENLVEHFHDSILSISLNGTITFCNKGSERIFELSSNEIIKSDIQSLFKEYSPDFFRINIIENTIRSGFSDNVLVYLKENTKKHISLNLSTLTDEIGEVFGLVCYCKDVTEKVTARESAKTHIANLKAIFNGVTEAIYLVDKNYILVDMNRLALQYQKKIFLREAKPGDSVFEIFYFLHTEDLRNLIRTTLEGVSHFIERSAVINKAQRFFKITIYPVIQEDKKEIDRFCISLADITENKAVEKELEDTKSELKPLFDSSIQRFYLSDLNSKIVAFNKAAKDIIMKEFNRSIKRGDYVMDFVTGYERQSFFQDKFEDAKKGHSIVYKEKILIRDNEVWNETHLDPVMNDRGEIYRVLIWTLDVTESEQNLNALKETQERYALVAKGGNDGIWDWDIIHNTVYLSPRWKALLGYEDYELKNEFGLRDSFIHPDDFENSKKILDDYISGRLPVYENEYRLKHKSGNYVWVSERGVIQFDEKGKPSRMAGSINDITRLKNIENELRGANMALLEERNMFIQGSVVIARVKADDTTKVAYISENVRKVLGFTVEEFLSGAITYDKLIHKGDKEHHLAERNKALAANSSNIEFSPYRMMRKDGSYIWVKDFASIIRSEKNKITDILGYFIDITEQKNTELILQESQKKYYSLFKDASDAIIIVDDDKAFDCNEKALELFGYTREEFIGLEMLKLMPEKQPSGALTSEKRKAKIEEAYKGKISTYYWQYKKKDNTIFDAEVSLNLIEIQDKKYLHGIIRDISYRKQIERSLRESEQKYKALLDAIPDLLFIVDKNGLYSFFKPDIYHELEVPENNVVGKKLEDFFSGDMLQKVKVYIGESLKTSKVQVVEYELPSPKGMRKFEARISPIDSEHILMLVRDKGQG